MERSGASRQMIGKLRPAHQQNFVLNPFDGLSDVFFHFGGIRHNPYPSLSIRWRMDASKAPENQPV
jgi:hypothetical protein